MRVPIAALLPVVLCVSCDGDRVAAEPAAEAPRAPWEIGVARTALAAVVEFQKDGTYGSGFLVGAAGLVATADHVLREADRYRVVFHDGVAAEAVVLERSLGDDLALLRIEGLRDRPFLAVSDAGPPETGTPVVLVGNQHGRHFLASWGHVASSRTGYEQLNRPEEWFEVLYFDAETLPGSSGGPWIDPAGRVVAVNTGGFPDDRTGFQYGVPARRLAQRIARTAAPRPSLRSEFADVWIGAGNPEPRGPRVKEPEPGGPLARAGVRENDRIVAVDAKPCDDINSMWRLLEPHRPGDVVRLGVWKPDSGRTSEVETTLAAARNGLGR